MFSIKMSSIYLQRRYPNSNRFYFRLGDILGKVCNAPKDKSGVYIVYGVRNNIDVLYIGSSGKMTKNGKIKNRKGGIYDRIVNGKQFGLQRNISWSIKMRRAGIQKLIIYWYDTFSGGRTDIPAYVEAVLIQRYFERFGRLPAWNKKF